MTSSPTWPTPPATDPIVDVRDVFVAFRGAAASVMALRGADLMVLPGERLLVQGPNGSGKSTLLRVITGEQAVVAGSVRVGGTALHELGVPARRRWRALNIGFIDQHARRSLLPEQDVLDNVALQLRLTGLGAPAARERARATLDGLGLAHLAHREIAALSGGEAQRVAICAAVAHAPALVLADEPTGELDEHSAREVYEMLSRIADHETSVILVSHDPRSDVFADRAVRVRDGRVAEQWRPGDPVVEQVPDSRGWIRVPAELLPSVGPGRGLVASATDAGLSLRPRARHADVAVSASGPASARTHPTPAPPQSVPQGSAPNRWLVDPAGTPLVELTAVAAAYPGQPLYADLALDLHGGDWVVVTGDSGSGKSTLLSLVAGLADPVSGTVRIAGTSWSGLDRPARGELRRQWVAVAPQRPSLVETLTVRENLALTLVIRGLAIGDNEIELTADRLGLTALLDQGVDRLSGGERQRVALARCLAADVAVLVLDEPTSQQDEVSAARVIAVLQAEVDAGRAILAASHDPRLTEHALRIVNLDREPDHRP